ncbi:hypothetical protein [Brachyspira innocens]|uniref:hypothetical protein n=1 Tax=Brachyspira innocens TaxID=13264 RepID=UPI0026EE32BA|nr:hypothetical protein [Brachyspira innocens]
MDKTVCEFCNKEIDSEKLIILRAFQKKEALGCIGEVQVWEGAICYKCFSKMMFEAGR